MIGLGRSIPSRSGRRRDAYLSARSRYSQLQRRFRDPALTVLTVLLLTEIFVIVPLLAMGLAPRLLVSPLVPVFIAAVVVASDHIIAVMAVGLGMTLALLATVLHLTVTSALSIYLHLIAGLVVACALFWVVARAVFAPGRITYHRIVGTLLLYLTIGVMFASLYGLAGLLVAHPFSGMPRRDDVAAVIAHALYFSFSTLTTAGYGDITPSHAITRGLSNLEAVIGQLFPATVIARMVTLHLADRDQ